MDLPQRGEALAALRHAIGLLDEIRERMAAIHVSHAIELLGGVAPELEDGSGSALPLTAERH